MNYSNEQRSGHFPSGNRGSDTSTYGRTWGGNNNSNSSNSSSSNSSQGNNNSNGGKKSKY